MQSSDNSQILTDDRWKVIEPVLIATTGQRRKAHRQFIEASLTVLRSGEPWRNLDPRHGSWNTIYVKFRRWAAAGIWDALLPSLVTLGIAKDWKISYEDSEGFPTTIRIIVEQARALTRDGVVEKSIVELVAESAPYLGSQISAACSRAMPEGSSASDDVPLS